MRLRAALSALALLLAMLVPRAASAQAIPTVQWTTTVTNASTGVQPALALTGQSSCSVVVAGSAAGFSIVPQASSDAQATWVNATNIGNGNITAVGTYVGGIAATGLLWFRVNVVSLTSGTATITYSCSGAVSNSSSSSAAGSVTSAGTNGTLAQAVQGITGGVPLNTNVKSQNASAGPITANGTYAVTTGGILNVCTVALNSGWAGGSVAMLVSNNNGTNYSSAAYTSTVGGVGSSATAPGSYVVPVGGQTNFEIIVTGYSTGSAYVYCDVSNTGPAVATNTVQAGVNSSGGAQFIICDQTKAINISTATTTAVVAVSGSTAVYICGYHLYFVSGTTPAFQFEYGAGTACATSPTVLSGTFGGIASAVGASFAHGEAIGAVLQTPASQGFCIVTTGTTPNLQGYVTFAQR